MSTTLIEITAAFAEAVGRLRFGPPVSHIYNTLEYGWQAHQEYLKRFATGHKRVVFVGMNPGPWGMVQTAVPFGDVPTVRGWLGISAPMGKPAVLHPKRPVNGWSCSRREVSGRRLWGLMQERFGRAELFFKEHFVANYCPLAFFSADGSNLTPDKLPAAQRNPLLEVCDFYLTRTLKVLQPQWAVGIGRFAADRIRLVCFAEELAQVKSGAILHPSPASPQANRGWKEQVSDSLKAMGIW